MNHDFDGSFAGHLFINDTFRSEVCGEWSSVEDCESVFRQVIAMTLETDDGAYYAGMLDGTNAHELATLAAEDSAFTLAVGTRLRQAMRDIHKDAVSASADAFEAHTLNVLILFLAALCTLMAAAIFFFGGEAD